MNEPLNFNNVDEERIINFLQGKLSVDEMKVLQEWIQSSEENRIYFEKIRYIWQCINTDTVKRFNPETGWKKIQYKIRESSIINQYNERHKIDLRIRRVFRIAAIFILLFASGSVFTWLIFSKTSLSPSGKAVVIHTPNGSKSNIILPDGSSVWLNAGSKLTYDNNFNRAQRIVNLEGEGYFHVTSNKKKPFIVHTSQINVKAFGTKFNVKAYPEEDKIITTLVEGKVSVENSAQNTRKFTYILHPNQNITYFKTDKNISYSRSKTKKEKERLNDNSNRQLLQSKVPESIKINKDVKTDLYTSWKDKSWVIEEVTLSDLAPLLERRFNTNIEIQTDAIKNYRFTGTIQNETLEQVLDIIRLTAPVKYKIGKGWVIWELDKSLEAKYKNLLK